MADHDGGSGQGGGGGGGPMVVDTQAVGTGPGAAAQLPGQRTAAPVQRPGPHPDAASMDDLIEFELEMLGAGPRSGCRVLQADSGLTTLRLLSPWLAGEPVPGRASVVVATKL